MPKSKEFYENLVNTVLSNFADNCINVHKYQSSDLNIYRQGESMYAAAVECIGKYTRRTDDDTQDWSGRTNEDVARFTFSLPELRCKFPSETEGEWITNKDLIQANSTVYTVTGVLLSGHLQDYNVVVIYGKEFPDTFTVV